jgi:hypothetical protein
MLSVILMNVDMQNVILQNVEAPFSNTFSKKKESLSAKLEKIKIVAFEVPAE